MWSGDDDLSQINTGVLLLSTVFGYSGPGLTIMKENAADVRQAYLVALTLESELLAGMDE